MTQRLLLRTTDGGKAPEEEVVAASSGRTGEGFWGVVLGGDEHDINRTMANPMPHLAERVDRRRVALCIVLNFRKGRPTQISRNKLANSTADLTSIFSKTRER